MHERPTYCTIYLRIEHGYCGYVRNLLRILRMNYVLGESATYLANKLRICADQLRILRMHYVFYELTTDCTNCRRMLRLARRASGADHVANFGANFADGWYISRPAERELRPLFPTGHSNTLQVYVNKMPPKATKKRRGRLGPRASSTVVPPLPSLPKDAAAAVTISSESQEDEDRPSSSSSSRVRPGPGPSQPTGPSTSTSKEEEQEKEEEQDTDYLPEIDRVEEEEEEEEEDTARTPKATPEPPQKGKGRGKGKGKAPATKDTPYHKSCLSMEEKEAIIEWWQLHECLFNPRHKHAKNIKYRALLVKEQAEKMGVSEDRITTFMRSARTQYGKITAPDKKPSGAGGDGTDEEVTEQLSDTNEWLKNKLAFMSPYIKRLKVKRRTYSQQLVPSTSGGMKRSWDEDDSGSFVSLVSDDDILDTPMSSQRSRVRQEQEPDALASTIQTLQNQLQSIVEEVSKQKDEVTDTEDADILAFGRTCMEEMKRIPKEKRLKIHVSVLQVFSRFHEDASATTPAPTPAPAPAQVADFYQPVWYETYLPQTPQPPPPPPPHTQHYRWGTSPPRLPVPRQSTPLRPSLTVSPSGATAGTTTTTDSICTPVTSVTVTSSSGDDKYPALDTPILEDMETDDDESDDFFESESEKLEGCDDDDDDESSDLDVIF